MISIIVPVYNVKNYLRRCLDSILAQDYQDYEVILVDDGSTDGSERICDEYAAGNGCFRVFHQANGGPSAARNKGNEMARGEYIIYIDSDDMVLPDYLSTLAGLIDRYGADIAVCDFTFFTEGETLPPAPEEGQETGCLDGYEAAGRMLYGRLHGSSACAMLMAARIPKGIQFAPGKYHEDDLISYRYYAAADKVAYTGRKLYGYFQRPNSIMHQEYNRIAVDQLDAADTIAKTCREQYSRLNKPAAAMRLRSYLQMLRTYPEVKEKDPETYGRIQRALKENRKTVLTDPRAVLSDRLNALILCMGGTGLWEKITQLQGKRGTA